MWLGGVSVACQTRDRKVTGLTLVWCTPGNNSGQVVHTHVPLFTKQYNLVPAKGQWRSAAGKVIVGLALHWTCITGWVVCPSMGSAAIEREMSIRSRMPLVKYDSLYFYLSCSPSVELNLVCWGGFCSLCFFLVCTAGIFTNFTFLVNYLGYSCV